MGRRPAKAGPDERAVGRESGGRPSDDAEDRWGLDQGLELGGREGGSLVSFRGRVLGRHEIKGDDDDDNDDGWAALPLPDPAPAP